MGKNAAIIILINVITTIITLQGVGHSDITVRRSEVTSALGRQLLAFHVAMGDLEAFELSSQPKQVISARHLWRKR